MNTFDITLTTRALCVLTVLAFTGCAHGTRSERYPAQAETGQGSTVGNTGGDESGLPVLQIPGDGVQLLIFHNQSPWFPDGRNEYAAKCRMSAFQDGKEVFSKVWESGFNKVGDYAPEQFRIRPGVVEFRIHCENSTMNGNFLISSAELGREVVNKVVLGSPAPVNFGRHRPAFTQKILVKKSPEKEPAAE